MSGVDELLTAIAAAEAGALTAHLNGTCQLSGWSCSHCEQAGGS